MTVEDAWAVDGNGSGSYTSPLDKGTLHTTEGGSIEGAIAAFQKRDSWPHKTVDYRKGKRRVCRHLPFTEAARALRNTSAPGQTNRDGTIQYELVGSASTILDQYDEADWLALGADVIGPDFRTCGIPLVCTVTMPTYPPPNGELLGSESTRLTHDEIDAVVGLVGHCNWPENCVDSGALVLTADLRWVPAGLLAPGDVLVGFEETPGAVGSTNGRRYVESVVESNGLFSSESIAVTTPNGTIFTTPNHPWLVRSPHATRGQRVGWVESKDLDPAKHEVYSIGRPWTHDRSHNAGYLAGLLDADGHYAMGNSGRSVGFGQVPGEVLEHFKSAITERGYEIRVSERTKGNFANSQPFVDVWVKGGLWSAIGLLGTLQPLRLLATARRSWQGVVVGKSTKRVPIISVQPGPPRVMASLTTSTRTFVAEGHLMHNTHGDPGPLTAKHYRGGTTSAIDLILEGAGATPEPPKGWLMALTDKEQEELLAKVREIYRETVESIEPDEAKGVKASGRWLLAKIYQRTGDLVTGRRP